MEMQKFANQCHQLRYYKINICTKFSSLFLILYSFLSEFGIFQTLSIFSFLQ